MQTWEEAQIWEKEWHSDCVNSLNEELKQLVYAKKIGLQQVRTHRTPYNFDLKGKSVIDIGGGAYSLLLKAFNFDTAIVIDPLSYPDWVKMRYEAHGIKFINEPAETAIESKIGLENSLKYDEAWIYNCLQHVQDPEKIIKNARNMAKVIRIFEWIDLPACDGHIQVLTEKDLNQWLGGEGKVEMINDYGCIGKCYYGIFV